MQKKSKKIKNREQFIDENAYLFWYIRKDALHQISDDTLVEFITNYGTLDALKELFEILGAEKIKKVYDNIQGRKKGNYFPEYYNFLGLIVNKYVSQKHSK